jgi:hypothetical protein
MVVMVSGQPDGCLHGNGQTAGSGLED